MANQNVPNFRHVKGESYFNQMFVFHYLVFYFKCCKRNGPWFSILQGFMNVVGMLEDFGCGLSNSYDLSVKVHSH